MIRRREFMTLVGNALASSAIWPVTASAQKAISRLGVLLFGTPDNDPNFGAFRQGLRDLGYFESQNTVIEYRYADGKPERLPALRLGGHFLALGEMAIAVLHHNDCRIHQYADGKREAAQ